MSELSLRDLKHRETMRIEPDPLRQRAGTTAFVVLREGLTGHRGCNSPFGTVLPPGGAPTLETDLSVSLPSDREAQVGFETAACKSFREDGISLPCDGGVDLAAARTRGRG